MMMNTVHFSGVNFRIGTLQSSIPLVREAVSQGKSIHLLATHSLTSAQNDANLINIFNSSISICDSAVIAKLISRSGVLFAAVRGTDFFRTVLKESNSDFHHFFLGGNEKDLKAMIELITNQYPNVHIAGYLSPDRKPLNEEEMRGWAESIKASGANLLWVSLGSPKQDFAAYFLSRELNIGAVGVGAAFDFILGTKAEAPAWIQRMRLEWLFRLAQEPIRLFPRYLGNAVHLIRVLRLK
jgi:N-acetylglucosaminyldiphosphoundecaprenol N-acetyl-beta-D-mannosaminyltransferase